MTKLLDQIDSMPASDLPLGLVIVDHGSRKEKSNELLLAAAAFFQQQTGMEIVEPAHMELAEPSIAVAFARCVEQGARTVVVFPYFLSPGRHVGEDIPRLAEEAASTHVGVRCWVAEPFGLHPLMATILGERIADCLDRTISGR